MDWSADGQSLAIIQEKSPGLLIWDAKTKELLPEINTSLKHLTILKWSNEDTVNIFHLIIVYISS